MSDTVALNLYEILGILRQSCADYEAVTFAEIKQGYHSALLAHHPDKQLQREQGHGAGPDEENMSFTIVDDNSGITIPAIKTAYRILSNAERRKDYNSQLRIGGNGTVLTTPRAASDQIDLDDMNCRVEIGPDGVSETCTWTRSCRCGESEGYILNEQDLEKNGLASNSITVQCIGCSLWIEVLYEVMEEE
ncbi:uncharacterized protein SAPINGB_P004764 [Magnusiomyces paraingens]|uniref:Diphthamide biosynthesis protein 4 n=1 Tax=Magnusiomyces paraingens TaxID=2606893 RepID=A0A5E8BYX5_9ASCO|nr:uncharacterized protein SAPINGB_P004764 [Saprochaete ingens]VVT55839.1 unnamed protein product [Saprochaete ingens]